MRARTWIVAITLSLGGSIVAACSLNPQPLPPAEFTTGSGQLTDASTAAAPEDSGAAFQNEDAAYPASNVDAGNATASAIDGGGLGDAEELDGANDAGDAGETSTIDSGDADVLDAPVADATLE